MSDTPLDGPSGPSPEGSVAPSTPKKPWRHPIVITSAFTPSDTGKIYAPGEEGSAFGPS